MGSTLKIEIPTLGGGMALLALALLLLLGSCAPGGGAGKASPVAKETEVESPSSLLHDQLRSGAVQAQGGVETLQEAQEVIDGLKKTAQGDEKDALAEIEDFMASAADACAEYGVEPPPPAEIGASFAQYDDLRLKAITELNDALVDLRSAKGAADSLSESAEEYGRLAQILDLALKDLEESITGFGGKVVEEDADGGLPESPSGP